MIYYNTLDESGFDIIDSLMESPIFDEYVNYDSIVSESALLSEKQEIKLSVLREFAIKDVLGKIKEALKAIKDFFLKIIEKIKTFFKKLSIKKISDIAKKNVANDPNSDTQVKIDWDNFKPTVEKIRTRDDNGNLTKEYLYEFLNKTLDKSVEPAKLDANSFINETIDTSRLKDFDKVYSLAKSSIKKIDDTTKSALESIFKDSKTDPKALCVIKGYDGGSIDGFISEKAEKCVVVPGSASLRTLIDFCDKQSEKAQLQASKMNTLFKGLVDRCDKISKSIDDVSKLKDESQVASLTKCFRMLIQSLNISKQGTSVVTKKLLDCTKATVKILIKLASVKIVSDKSKAAGKNAELSQSEVQKYLDNMKESYNPWAGIED